jgi:hypothetical protein
VSRKPAQLPNTLTVSAGAHGDATTLQQVGLPATTPDKLDPSVSKSITEPR